MEAVAVVDQPGEQKLHLGCGSTTPSTWVNVDGSWNARVSKHKTLQRVLRASGVLPDSVTRVAWSSDIVTHNVRKPLPYPAKHFSAVYASHLLEHLYRDEAERLLAECFRVLIPGGVLRIVVPDLHAIIADYVSTVPSNTTQPHPTERYPADMVNERLLLRDRHAPMGGIFYRTYSQFVDFHSHKWMYDAQSLSARFIHAGFEDVKECAYLDSRIPGIADVENESRVLEGGLCIEGVKPEGAPGEGAPQ